MIEVNMWPSSIDSRPERQGASRPFLPFLPFRQGRRLPSGLVSSRSLLPIAALARTGWADDAAAGLPARCRPSASPADRLPGRSRTSGPRCISALVDGSVVIVYLGAAWRIWRQGHTIGLVMGRGRSTGSDLGSALRGGTDRRVRRRHDRASTRSPAGDAAGDRGTRGGRVGQRGEERFSGDDEPRDPDADQRRHRPRCCARCC